MKDELMADWPMVSCDVGRTGFSASQIRPPLKLRWKAKIHKGQKALYHSNRLFVLCDDEITVIELESGLQIWAHKGNKNEFKNLGMALGQNQVFVASEIHFLMALDAIKGKVLWHLEDRDEDQRVYSALHAPTYLAAHNGYLATTSQVYKAETGTLISDYSSIMGKGATGLSLGELDSAILCFHTGFPEHKDKQGVYRYRLGDVNPTWFVSAPSVYGLIIHGNLIVANGDGIRALRAADGAKLWSLKEPGVGPVESLAHDRIFCSRGQQRPTRITTETFYTPVCLDASSGQPVWENKDRISVEPFRTIATEHFIWQLRYTVPGWPVVHTYFLEAVEYKSGEVHWQTAIPARPEHHLVADDLLVIVCRSSVYCFEMAGSSAPLVEMKMRDQAPKKKGIGRRPAKAKADAFDFGQGRKLMLRPKGDEPQEI